MSEAVAETPRLAAGARLGSYTITRCIGEGGMGVVYEGLHEGLGKRVAIKTLHAPSARSPELTTRFVREGKAAAKVRHPNVVDVFDVSVHEGTPYLVMEYLEGEDLGAFMSHDAPMGARAIADLIVPVAAALASAHEAGIIHRDLKPDNIFLTRGKGGAVEPKLVDFGISKVTDGESLQLTGTHAILGTPYYMSPEQAGSSKLVDHRSDIFSLGVILYQCATHELPFKGDSLFQLLGEIMHRDPPPVRSLSEQVPPEFEALIARAMQKDPSKRFQSAAELGVALLPFASQRVRLTYERELGQSHASSPSLPPVAPAPTRSRAWLAGVAVAVVALAAAAFILRGARSREDEEGHRVTPRVADAPAAIAAEPKPSAAPAAVPVPSESPARAAVVAEAPSNAAPAQAAPTKPAPADTAGSQPSQSAKHAAAHARASHVAAATPAPAVSAPPKPAADDPFRDRK